MAGFLAGRKTKRARRRVFAWEVAEGERPEHEYSAAAEQVADQRSRLDDCLTFNFDFHSRIDERAHLNQGRCRAVISKITHSSRIDRGAF